MALNPTPGPGVKTPYDKPGILDTALNILDPGKVRLQIAGLFGGGKTSSADKNSQPTQNSNIYGNPANNKNKEWRVRISLPPKSKVFYNDPNNPMQKILARTNGVIFPYTPTVSVAHNARYQEQALTHSNYKNYFYEGSDVAPITIAGDFTVQNVDEGLYLLAAIYFFRSATKMFFGKDSLAGNPPSIVYLDGYGDFYFPHVSCVVTSFSHTMPAEVDYVEIPYSSSTNNPTAYYENDGTSSTNSTGIVRLPTTSTLSVTVQPVYSRNNIHNNMSLTDFSQGRLLSNQGNGNRAGFL